jgi:hypothetical protein
MEPSDGSLHNMATVSYGVYHSNFFLKLSQQFKMLYRPNYVPQFEVCFLTGGTMELYKALPDGTLMSFDQTFMLTCGNRVVEAKRGRSKQFKRITVRQKAHAATGTPFIADGRLPKIKCCYGYFCR